MFDLQVMLKDKNILLGVCGSIASYKSAFLIRLLVKTGANVRVIMTEDAKSFISPLTLSTLSKNEVFSSYYDNDTGNWHNHVELALWADLLLIAPATANTIAKFANGLCDNLLSATYLSAKCPVYFAPAMDLDMWKHASTQKNISSLVNFGNYLIQPDNGELASGLHGEGRMAEPENIINYLTANFEKQPLKDKKALITAGPTFEKIDPVRFIGNFSSGKMGFAVAEELKRLGADVTLVCGPNHLKTDYLDINVIRVTNADEMLNACLANFNSSDICIMAAAVADYKAVHVADQKIKKQKGKLVIEFEKTTDILQTLGEQKKPGQILVGFALETENEEQNAKEKLKRKNLDFIVLNSLRDEGAGFAVDTNKIKIIDQHTTVAFEVKSKTAVAKDICTKIVDLLTL